MMQNASFIWRRREISGASEKIIKLGAEKVAISSIIFERPESINEMAAVMSKYRSGH